MLISTGALQFSIPDDFEHMSGYSYQGAGSREIEVRYYALAPNRAPMDSARNRQTEGRGEAASLGVRATDAIREETIAGIRYAILATRMQADSEPEEAAQGIAWARVGASEGIEIHYGEMRPRTHTEDLVPEGLLNILRSARRANESAATSIAPGSVWRWMGRFGFVIPRGLSDPTEFAFIEAAHGVRVTVSVQAGRGFATPHADWTQHFAGDTEGLAVETRAVTATATREFIARDAASARPAGGTASRVVRETYVRLGERMLAVIVASAGEPNLAALDAAWRQVQASVRPARA